MEKHEKSDGVVAVVSKRTEEREGVLEIAPRIYRDYANEFRELARTSESDAQRATYLKAVHMWLDAATLFEFEIGRFNSRREQQKPAA